MIPIVTNKIMLVTNELQASPAGGRELLCKLNYDLLKAIYGDQLLVVELSRGKLQGLMSVLKAFSGQIDGLNNDMLVDVLQTIKVQQVSKVFVDGSNLGELVKQVKTHFPHVQVCTFFHNVEARFFLGSLRQTKTLRALAVLLVNYLAERKSVRYSDKLVCLSDRDSQLLHKLYGRSATHLSPMALQDKLPVDCDSIKPSPSREKFALFVGGVFYANRAGIFWFVKHVAPRINIKTYVVGKGFENYKEALELNGKVKVIGPVDSLAQWYLDSHFVIAPIFDGSGMKTKVAEALMFGKKIVGTPEAFSGYEEIAGRAGRVCHNADDFVLAIESVDTIINCSFDHELRAIYASQYSYAAAKLRIEKIMNQ